MKSKAVFAFWLRRWAEEMDPLPTWFSDGDAAADAEALFADEKKSFEGGVKLKRPKMPPNQWVPEGDLNAPFDVVTGNCRIDREIARDRGLYPQPWWRRLRWALFGGELPPLLLPEQPPSPQCRRRKRFKPKLKRQMVRESRRGNR